MGQVVRNLCIVDKDTGEVVEDYAVFIGKTPRHYDRGYVKVFVSFLSDMIESDEIAGKSIRLLFYMLQSLDWHSLEVIVIPREAREALGISKTTYYKWIEDLIKFGLIEKVSPYRYRLKPYTFVKGSHEKASQLELRAKESKDDVNHLDKSDS